MRTVILLSAMAAAVFGIPTGGYGPAPAAPPALTYSAPKTYYSAPAPQPQQAYYVAAPAQPVYAPASKLYAPTGPIVTGTLHHTQDTYGQYNFGYESSDGQAKTETKQGDGGVTGSFSYVDPEGQKVELQYTAGKEGFQASGEHLPQAPAVPDLPEELASAYRDAHDRLAQAYEEARLRGDTDLYTDDGSYKNEHRDAGYAGEAPSAPAQQAAYYNVAPVSYAAAPVASYNAGFKTYQAAYPAAAYPAPVKSSSYAVSAPAPAAPAYSAPKAPSAPAPYSSSSYSTNIGGTPVAAPVRAPAKSGYAFSAPAY